MKSKVIYKSDKVSRFDYIKIATLELNQKNIMEELQRFNLENKEQHSEILSFIVRLEEKLDIALEKKANKWMEKAMVGTVVFVLTGFASYLGVLIVQTMLHVK